MTRKSHYTGVLLSYLQVILFSAIILYYGRGLFIPIFFALFISIVLFPVCHWLERHRWPRSVAVAAALLIVIILFGSLVFLVIVQVKIFMKDAPEFMTKLEPSLLQLQQRIESGFGISLPAQQEWWRNTVHNFGNNAGSIALQVISTTGNTLITLLLIPVFAALFLYNRGAFVQFLAKLAGEKYKEHLRGILHEVIHTYFNFMRGMLMVYLIVGTLNSIGLLALGIPHAILFGMLTAVMTIIPYAGIIISSLLPISVAWITKDSVWYPLGVIAVFAIVQYLEATVIYPRVVATQLRVSTWTTLVAIITGGILWGIPGIILFIPFVGILKIILDHTKVWEPLNILLGRKK